jgi:hypothetical protein
LIQLMEIIVPITFFSECLIEGCAGLDSPAGVFTAELSALFTALRLIASGDMSYCH